MDAEQQSSFHYPVRALEDDCLRLEPILDEAAYVELVFKLLDANTQVFRYMSLASFEPTSTGGFPSLAAFRDQWFSPNPGDPTKILYLVIVKNASSFSVCGKTFAGEPAGLIGLINTKPANLVTEMGYVVFLPAWQRTFVSTHAIGLLLMYCLDHPEQGGLGLRRVSWQCHSENKASVRAAERMGFVFEGVQRWTRVLPVGNMDNGRREVRKGERPGSDTAMLSLTWEDWVLDGKREFVEGMMKNLVPEGEIPVKWKVDP